MSDNIKVVVNISNINDVKIKMLNEINNLLMDMEKAKDIIIESEKVFDTDTSKYFRKKTLEYIESEKKNICDDLIPYVSLLSNITSLYNDTLLDIEKEFSE